MAAPAPATPSCSQSGSPPPRNVRTSARFLFLLDGTAAADLASWSRVFDLFDGQDEAAVAAARQRWAAAKAAGHTLTYWQQGERGWKKA